MNLPLATNIFPAIIAKKDVFYLIPEYQTCFIDKSTLNQRSPFDIIDPFGFDGFFSQTTIRVHREPILIGLTRDVGYYEDPSYYSKSNHQSQTNKRSKYLKIIVILLAILYPFALFYILKRKK